MSGPRERAVEFFLDRHRPNESEPYLRIARIPGGYFLHHLDGIDLEVLEAGRRVVIVHRDPALSQVAVDHILNDQLLPLVVAHLGRLSFHGSAMAWDDAALCFLANAGTGKSTLAATLVARGGAQFVADDHVVLEEHDGTFVVHPSYPSVRLWDASAATLFDAPATGRSKRHFPLPTVAAPVAVRAMVLLACGPPNGPAVVVHPLTRRDGLVGVSEHLDRLDPMDREALRRELEQLAKLVEKTPIARVTISRDLGRLDEVAEAIRDWVLRA